MVRQTAREVLLITRPELTAAVRLVPDRPGSVELQFVGPFAALGEPLSTVAHHTLEGKWP
jgi:hypothetical protein